MTDKHQAAAKTAADKAEAERIEANSGLTAPSASQKAAAQVEGATEAVKDKAKDVYNYLTDGNLPGDPPGRQFTGKSEIMQYAHIVDLGLDEFVAAVQDDAVPAIPEEKCAGLLELERSGKNRTDYVQALMKRLKVKSPYEVTSAGPAFTNDVTSITKL